MITSQKTISSECDKTNQKQQIFSCLTYFNLFEINSRWQKGTRE